MTITISDDMYPRVDVEHEYVHGETGMSDEEYWTNIKSVESPAILVGDQSAGKSLLLAYLAISNAEAGRNVYSTQALLPYAYEAHPMLKKYLHIVDDVDKFFAWRAHYCKTHAIFRNTDIFLADEAQVMWSSHESLSKDQNVRMTYITNSAKYGLEFFAAMQLMSSVNKALRGICKKMVLAIKRKDWRTHEIFFEYKAYAVNSETTEPENPRNWYMYSYLAKQVYPCYGTTKVSTVEEDVLEPKILELLDRKQRRRDAHASSTLPSSYVEESSIAQPDAMKDEKNTLYEKIAELMMSELEITPSSRAELVDALDEYEAEDVSIVIRQLKKQGMIRAIRKGGPDVAFNVIYGLTEKGASALHEEGASA